MGPCTKWGRNPSSSFQRTRGIHERFTHHCLVAIGYRFGGVLSRCFGGVFSAGRSPGRELPRRTAPLFAGEAALSSTLFFLPLPSRLAPAALPGGAVALLGGTVALADGAAAALPGGGKLESA